MVYWCSFIVRLFWDFRVLLPQYSHLKVCIHVILVHKVGDGGLEGEGGYIQQLLHHLCILRYRRKNNFPPFFNEEEPGGGGILLPNIPRHKRWVYHHHVECVMKLLRNSLWGIEVIVEEGRRGLKLVIKLTNNCKFSFSDCFNKKFNSDKTSKSE